MFFFETEFETGTLDFLIVVKRIFEIGQQITQISTHYLKTGPHGAQHTPQGACFTISCVPCRPKCLKLRLQAN